MSTVLSYTPKNKKIAHFGGFSSTDIEKYYEIFGDSAVFTNVKPRVKAGFEGWNKPENLHTAKESQFLVNRNRNIGLALGIETNRGYTVCFDKESYGTIPESILTEIRDKALLEFESQSGGNNFVLTVSKDALDYLQRFKTKVTFQGDKHDLELLTSGHCIVPPSKIDENHQYDNLETYPEAPTVDLDSVVQILDNIPIDERENESGSNQQTTAEGENNRYEHKELPSDFDIESYCQENIPGVDSFQEILHHVITNIDRVNKLWFCEPSDRSENELALRRELAWYFFGDEKVIQYIFEEVLPNFRDKGLKYHENETHRKDVLNFQQYVSRPFYVNKLSFAFREQLSRIFLENEEISTNEVYNENMMNITSSLEQYSERQIRYGLQIFVELELIERTSRGKYKNKNIDEEYVKELEKLENYEEYKDIRYNK